MTAINPNSWANWTQTKDGTRSQDAIERDGEKHVRIAIGYAVSVQTARYLEKRWPASKQKKVIKIVILSGVPAKTCRAIYCPVEWAELGGA